VEIRPLTFADAPQSRRLSLEAFGFPRDPLPDLDETTWLRPGMSAWGAFEGDRLLAKVINRAYDSWFGGTTIATAGIAGVAVVSERRGEGLLGDLFDAVLAEARAGGAAISTLYPTAPGIYRRFGYELVGGLLTLEIPTASLATVRPGSGVVLRRATAADFDAIRAVYDRWAAGQNGPLTRRGDSFTTTAEQYVDSFSGVTLAERDGELLGFAAWQRGSGYDLDATIEVDDLICVDPGAAASLLHHFGTFSSVAGRVRLETSGFDAALFALRDTAWKPIGKHPYMLRLLDVPAALTARAYPPVDVSAGFSVSGHGLDGAWTLTVKDGAATCEPGSGEGARLTSYGLGLLYSGTQSTANLRFAGHLTGPSDTDALLDALFGGRQFHIRDYF